jgi:hypothetical protein
MPYYQEGCVIESFAYVSVLKPNISSDNMRKILVTTLSPVDLGY